MLQPQLSLVGAAVLPRLELGVQIVSGGPSALFFDAEQHASDKGMDGGFAGLILAVDDIQAVFEGKVPPVKFSKTVNIDIQNFHSVSSFHP